MRDWGVGGIRDLGNEIGNSEIILHLRLKYQGKDLVKLSRFEFLFVFFIFFILWEKQPGLKHSRRGKSQEQCGKKFLN